MASRFGDYRTLRYTGHFPGAPCPNISGQKCCLSSQEGPGQVGGHRERAERGGGAGAAGLGRGACAGDWGPAPAPLTAARRPLRPRPLRPDREGEGRGPGGAARGGPCENEAGARGPGGAGPGVSERGGHGARTHLPEPPPRSPPALPCLCPQPPRLPWASRAAAALGLPRRCCCCCCC